MGGSLRAAGLRVVAPVQGNPVFLGRAAAPDAFPKETVRPPVGEGAWVSRAESSKVLRLCAAVRRVAVDLPSVMRGWNRPTITRSGWSRASSYGGRSHSAATMGKNSGLSREF